MLHRLLEAMVLAGQYEWALQEAGQVFMDESRPSPSARTAMWACRAAAQLERWGQVVTWADCGLADQPVEPEQEGILRLCKAGALLNLGDLNQAEQELQAFLLLADRTAGLSAFVGDALYSLGHLHQLLRNPRQAISAFEEASAAYALNGQDSMALQSRFEVAWSYLIDGCPGEARIALKAVQAGLLRHPNHVLERDTAIAMALYHSLCGERLDSDRICLALLDQTGLPDRQVAEIAWILGHNSLTGGDLVAAGYYLDTAYRAAAEEWSPCQLHRIRQLRERVSHHPC